MNIELLSIIGLVTGFNVLIIYWKFSNKRYADAILDTAILVSLGIIFGKTLGGLVVAMISSAIVSLYLLVFPPTFFKELI